MNDIDLFILMFTGIWCLVGTIFLCVGIGLRRSYLNKEARLRARATGTVIEVVRRVSHGSDGASTSFYPIVAFTADGKLISLESGSGGGRKKYYEGQSVEVLYDPDDPACFRIEGEHTTRLFGGIFLAVGIGCIAIGVIAALLINMFRAGIHIN